jgi:hypothetical protein
MCPRYLWRLAQPLPPLDTPQSPAAGCIIVIGQNVWGKGKTIEDARKAAGLKASARYLAYEFEDGDAGVDGMGNTIYKSGTTRKLLGKFDKGKQIE